MIIIFVWNQNVHVSQRAKTKKMVHKTIVNQSNHVIYAGMNAFRSLYDTEYIWLRDGCDWLRCSVLKWRGMARVGRNSKNSLVLSKANEKS